jgi:hypothetical protein
LFKRQAKPRRGPQLFRSGPTLLFPSLANTVVPSLDRPEDPTGFWRLCGCDLKADAVVAEGLLQLPEEQRAGVLALLDGLHVLGFATGSRRSCEQLMRNVALMGAALAAGSRCLRARRLLRTARARAR